MEEKKVEAAAPAGKSFKKLKQQLGSKKNKRGKTKTGSGPDPDHPAFLAGLKGITSALVDFEAISSDHWLFVLVAEENAQLSAFAVDQDSPDAKPRVISRNCKLEGGVKLTSATFSLLKEKGQASQNISLAEAQALPQKFIVAASCFDHC